VIKCKTPVAFGMKAKGDTLQTGLFVPKPLIKDIVQAVMATRAGITGRPDDSPTPAKEAPAPLKSDF
jgi:hypothetical protein